MSSKALSSSAEDREEEWLWSCTVERGLKEKEMRTKPERGATAVEQGTQSQPAQVAFYVKILLKLPKYGNKHKPILSEQIKSREVAWLYRQVTLVVN